MCRDGNPYVGHVPKSWTDHGGFVDPVKYPKASPGAAARLTATLTNATAKPFDGARIALEQLTGAAWTRVAAGLPSGKGRVAFAVK